MTDWYQVLQISRQASAGEIKSAYRQLAKNIIQMHIQEIRSVRYVLGKYP